MLTLNAEHMQGTIRVGTMTTVLYLNASGAISGAERSLLAMLDAVDRARWQPVVAAPDGPLHQEAAARGIPYLPLPLAPLQRPRMLTSWPRLLHQLRDGRRRVDDAVRQAAPGLVHANSTAAMLYAAQLDQAPVIWHVRDLVPLGTIGGWLYRRAARVAVISTAVRNDVLQYAGGNEQKIVLLPPAVDTAHFTPAADRPALKASFGLPADLPLIGLIAQFVPWKRHHLFLDLLADLADRRWHAVLAGAELHPDAAYLASIDERIARPPLAGRVSRLPWQPDAAPLLAALDLCVLTSQREPFGRVLAEAMACGVPCVAVDAAGPRDILLHGETGILAPDDPPALKRSIATLLDDETLRHRMGQAARERAVARFGLRRHGELLSEVYDKVTTGIYHK